MFNNVELDLHTGDCLLLVDIQNDFLEGGALAVPFSNHILPVVHYWISRFWVEGLPVVATMDWHPKDHCSFKEQGGLWEPHCVQGTEGALLAPIIRNLEQNLSSVFEIERFHKGIEPDRDTYSGFNVQTSEPYGEDARSDLDEWLGEHNVERLIIVGLATDYCVKATVEDAFHMNWGDGYQVVVLARGIAGVGVNEGDIPKALGTMAWSGATILQ